MIVERIGTNERLDQPFDLRKPEGLAQSSFFGPRLFERHTHRQVSPEALHLRPTGFAQILWHHVLVAQVSRRHKPSHILRRNQVFTHPLGPL